MSVILELTPDERLVPFHDISDVTSRVARLDAGIQVKRNDAGLWVTTRHGRSLQMMQDSFTDHLGEVRADSGFSAGLGMFNPRDLTHKMRRVLEEKLPVLSADRIFPIDREVPPSAIQYEQYREYASGEAVVYRGGNGEDVPTIELGRASFTQSVIWIVSRFNVDFLEALRGNATGIDTQARKMGRARRVLAEKRNTWAWNGASSYGLYGMLNHPYIDTAVSQVPYNADSANADILDDFGFWASYAFRTSGVAKPDTVVFAIDTYTYLAQTYRSDGSDMTLLEALQKGNPWVKNWEMAEGKELDNAGGTDVHAMVFMRRGSGGVLETSCAIVDPMPATLLPPNRHALGADYFMVQALGGLNHTDPDEELVVYVQGRSS